MLRWNQALIHLATSVQLILHTPSRSVRGRRALPGTRCSTEEGVRTCNKRPLHSLRLLFLQGTHCIHRKISARPTRLVTRTSRTTCLRPPHCWVRFEDPCPIAPTDYSTVDTCAASERFILGTPFSCEPAPTPPLLIICLSFAPGNALTYETPNTPLQSFFRRSSPRRRGVARRDGSPRFHALQPCHVPATLHLLLTSAPQLREIPLVASFLAIMVGLPTITCHFVGASRLPR